tara:strand:- start:31 stop:669 length:639 start_codon:yes stop_codon:yes gene_type:complete
MNYRKMNYQAMYQKLLDVTEQIYNEDKNILPCDYAKVLIQFATDFTFDMAPNNDEAMRLFQAILNIRLEDCSSVQRRKTRSDKGIPRKTNKDTWKKAFCRCSKKSLDVLQFIYKFQVPLSLNPDGLCAIDRNDMSKQLNINLRGLNGLIGRVNTCFWKLNKNKNLINYSKINNCYFINSKKFFKHFKKINESRPLERVLGVSNPQVVTWEEK